MDPPSRPPQKAYRLRIRLLPRPQRGPLPVPNSISLHVCRWPLASAFGMRSCLPAFTGKRIRNLKELPVFTTGFAIFLSMLFIMAKLKRKLMLRLLSSRTSASAA
jgi:hypothetical protein